VDTAARPIRTNRRSDPAARSVAELEVAIELVARGAARSVRLSGLPGAERLAASAAERAHAAGVDFRVERDPVGTVLSIGPRSGSGDPPR